MKRIEITTTAHALSLPTNWNKGQIAEALASYTLTGMVKRPDDTRFDVAPDFADVQCKTYHSTIAIGTTDADLIRYIDATACKQFAYVTKDLTAMYLMDKAEWTTLVMQFHDFDTCSLSGHMGEPSIRLNRAEKRMLKVMNAMM